MVRSVIPVESDIPGDLTIAEYKAVRPKPMKKRRFRVLLHVIARAF